MNQYKIITANLLEGEDLEAQVNTAISEGWLPLGGVAVMNVLPQTSEAPCAVKEGYYQYQAMINHAVYEKP